MQVQARILSNFCFSPQCLGLILKEVFFWVSLEAWLRCPVPATSAVAPTIFLPWLMPRAISISLPRSRKITLDPRFRATACPKCYDQSIGLPSIKILLTFRTTYLYSVSVYH